MATYSSAHFKNECLRSDLRSHLLLFEHHAAPGSGRAYDGSEYEPRQWDRCIFLVFFRGLFMFLGFGQRLRKGRVSSSARVLATAPPSSRSRYPHGVFLHTHWQSRIHQKSTRRIQTSTKQALGDRALSSLSLMEVFQLKNDGKSF